MGKRREDGSWQDSCLAKVQPGEPIFVLRSTDLLAPVAVDLWADMATANGTPIDKVAEARATANAMRAWGQEHGAKVPD